MQPTLQKQFLDITKNLSFINEIVQKITNGLSLTFIKINEVEGNVCFANSKELRSEFKETFTSKDLEDYIYATLHSIEYKKIYSQFSKGGSPFLSIPTKRIDFWKLVQKGEELRKTDTAHEENPPALERN